MKKYFGNLLWSGLYVLSVSGYASYVLIDKGQVNAAIVIATKPTTSAQLAAMELRDAVNKITGSNIPVVNLPEKDKINIYIGANFTEEQFSEQEYLIRPILDGILLAGLDAQDFRTVTYEPNFPEKPWKNLPDHWAEKGTLHAVYDLLENHMGVRFFSANSFGTHYPAKQTLELTIIEIRRKPFMHYRDISGKPENQQNRTAHLLKKNSADEKNFLELAFAPVKQRNPENDQAMNIAEKNLGKLFLLRRKFGGKVIKCNHSLMHYFTMFLDKNSNDFVDYRPEYFAQGYELGPMQLCFTNREAINLVAKEAELYFSGRDLAGKANGKYQWGKDNFAVVPNDIGVQCRCSECLKLQSKQIEQKGAASSELIFHFVNEIAKKVGQVNPDKTISCLAYQDYEEIPEIELNSNIAVHYCWTTNREPASRPFYQVQQDRLIRWAARKPPRGLYLWLYNTFPNERTGKMGWNCFPGFFARQAAAQYKLFKELGVKGIFHCGWGQELESYLSLRMMDDPGLDAEQIIKEYFELNFGPAAVSMRNFYELAENLYLSEDNTDDLPEIHWGRLGIPANMEKLRNCIEKARELAAGSPYRERVELWNRGIWLHMRKGYEHYQQMTASPCPEIKVPAIANTNSLESMSFDKAAVADQWYRISTDTPAIRKLQAKFLHDGKFLYAEFSDYCDISKLSDKPRVFAGDCWELFISGKRGGNYRQLAFNPSGEIVLLAHGEINFRKNVDLPLPPGTRAIRMESGSRLFHMRLSIPLTGLLPAPHEESNVFYLNVMRSARPGVAGTPDWTSVISSMVSFATMHDPFRTARIILQ